MEHLNTALQYLNANGLLPLTQPRWIELLGYWKYFSLVAPIQLLSDWYPMGKTSLPSILNVPGKSSWIFMELFSPASLLLAIYTNPTRTGPLPRSHVWLTTLYCMHYFHRALLSPIRNPSMAPVHILLVLMGIAFNIVNGSLIGAWLGGYGNAETVPLWQMIVGSAVFVLGLWGNVYHEEILRDIRGGPKEKGKNTDTVVSSEGRVYKVPRGGLFEYCWYPHYSSEWFEWTGYMIAGGGPLKFLPATLFVVNELATMVPRALQGKRWYLKKFGDKAPERKAAIPGLL